MQDSTATSVSDIEKDFRSDRRHKQINVIATAVEEQSSASSEIASNISQASQGIFEVFSQTGHDMEEETTGRRACVDGVGQALELDALFM